MLSVYVKKVRRELLAVLKHFDTMAWVWDANKDSSVQIKSHSLK